MFATLKESREGTLRNIAGSCPASAEFLSLLNEATRRLMRRGDWPDTVVPMRVCVRRGCVAFPRYVGQVRKINLCNEPMNVTNMYGSFMPHDYSHWNWWRWTDSDMFHSSRDSFGEGGGSVNRASPYGKTPMYSDVPNDDCLIRVYPQVKAAIGKTLTLFGVDTNGQPLKHKNDDGSWSEGIVLAIANPYGTTAIKVRRIDRVLLDDMQANVLLYAYDTVQDGLFDLAVYEPGETNPEYVRYQVNVPCGTQTINALIKVRFIPARFDTDLVLISNLDALKDYMQSIKSREAGAVDLANQQEAAAIHELNLDLNDQFPEDQMPVYMGVGFSDQPTLFLG